MPYDVEWKQGAIEDVTALFDYIAENSSLWDARNVTDRVLAAADKLADFPRLYEVDSQLGCMHEPPVQPDCCASSGNYRLESNPEKHAKTPLAAATGNWIYTREILRGLEVGA